MSLQEHYSDDIKVNNPFGEHWLDSSPRSKKKSLRYPDICTRAQAVAFYSSLDEFQQIMDDIQTVDEAEKLKALSNRADAWYRKIRPNTYVLVAEMVKLDRHFKHKLIEHMTEGKGDKPAEDALLRVRTMANADLEAIRTNAIADRELQINRAIVEKKLCSDRRAIRFYRTWEKLMWNLVDNVPEISDANSLKAWAVKFHAWRKRAWASFYKEPCGATAYYMDLFEALAYSAALAQLTELGNAVLEVVSSLLDDMVDFADDDSAVIED